MLEYKNKIFTNTPQSLTEEAPLQINLNGQPYSVTMRTPGDDEAMIRGLFDSEQILNSREAPWKFHVTKKQSGLVTAVNLEIESNYLGKGYKAERTFLSVSSCGICGKKELEDITCEDHQILTPCCKLEPERVTNMFEVMQQNQFLFKKTGGCHGASIFDQNYHHLVTSEDIGRHNAVDKSVGVLIMGSRLEKAEFLLVSGRISYEIVVKAYRAEIPYLLAVSAPSSLAVDLAEDLGITILGFCRENRFTCYSNCENLKKNN